MSFLGDGWSSRRLSEWRVTQSILWHLRRNCLMHWTHTTSGFSRKVTLLFPWSRFFFEQQKRLLSMLCHDLLNREWVVVIYKIWRTQEVKSWDSLLQASYSYTLGDHWWWQISEDLCLGFTDHNTGYLSARQPPKINSFHSVRLSLQPMLFKCGSVILMYELYRSSAKLFG
jgi:hypothetical protein